MKLQALKKQRSSIFTCAPAPTNIWHYNWVIKRLKNIKKYDRISLDCLDNTIGRNVDIKNPLAIYTYNKSLCFTPECNVM